MGTPQRRLSRSDTPRAIRRALPVPGPVVRVLVARGRAKLAPPEHYPGSNPAGVSLCLAS